MRDSTPDDEARDGVLIPRGVTLRIPPGGLSISVSKDGEMVAELMELHLQLNPCIDWLDVAFDHLRAADRAHGQLIDAHRARQAIAGFLRSEYLSAMQASVASATFFEALFAATWDCLPQARSAPRPIGRRGAARPAQVAEQLKRAFGLRKRGTANLSSLLAEIYRFRDEAVHPSCAFRPPVLHPDLGIVVEPRYVMYSHANTRQAVRGALAYCETLPLVAKKQGPKEIEPLARYLLEAGPPLCKRWRETYGPLRDDDAR